MRECPEFTTVDAFRFLDVAGVGFVTKEALARALVEEIKLDFEDRDIDLFFKRFDR